MRTKKTRPASGVRAAGSRSPWRSASPPAATATTTPRGLDRRQRRWRRDRLQPRQRQSHPDDRLEELPRTGNPRGDLRPGPGQAAGYKVKTDLNLGSETVALKALKSGQISGYPEYASTALTSFFGLEPEEVPSDAQAAYEKAKAGIRKGRPDGVPTDPVRQRQRGRDAEIDGRQKYGLENDLRPRRRLGKTDPLRLARVPPADRLPGRAGKALRAEIQVVQAGRHRPPLHGARKRPGRPLDPLHHRPAARRRRTTNS